MKSSFPPAIVVGLDCMTGLQTARILARHAIPAYGIVRNRGSAFARTRVCRQVVDAEAGDSTIEAIARLAATLAQPAVLYPCTDAMVLLLSRHRTELTSSCRLALPPHDVIVTLMDKLRFFEYASAHGLPIPRTLLLRDLRELEEVIQTFRFPVILKPPLRTARWLAHQGAKAYKLATPLALRTQFEQCIDWSDVLLAQEWIEGPDSNLFSCNCYLNAESKTLTTFVAKKIRQWPVEVGISSLGEECRNDVVLTETVRLFEGIRHQGLGYLEMKRDDRDGLLYIVEPNVGRPTGRSAIAETGGVDLLLCQYRDLTGVDVPVNLTQTYGHAKWIYLRQDLRSAWHYWRAHELTLYQWLRSMKGVRKDAIFSLRDPLPFLLDIREGLTRAFRLHRSKPKVGTKPRKACSVALVGSDGCGKTTLSQMLTRNLPIPAASIYMGINLTSDPAALSSTRFLNSAKRRIAPSGSLRRVRAIGRFLMLVAEEWHRLLLSARLRRQGTVVIYDRYFAIDFDEFLTRSQQRSWLDRFHSWLLRLFYPSPELTIYLDAPAEVLFRRKGEGTLEWLSQRREHFLAKVRTDSTWCTVDANQPLAEVYEQVEQRILQFVASRKAPALSRSATLQSVAPGPSRNK